MSELSEKIFLDRYALKDKEGNLVEHTPEEMWRRVARGIAKNEKPKDQKKWEQKFYDTMQGYKFVPAGRILSGAGTEYQVTYFNCFVIPSPHDSRHGILKALGQLVEIQARSGGVGLNLSSLRPRGARVKKVNGTSSGPINWAELFSVATHDIVQQGGSRRGATMLMLWDWHPDVEEFITVKQDLTKINGANLSVCISDDFMQAVKDDADWHLIYPELDDPMYDKEWDGDMTTWKEKGGKIKIYKTVKATYLWNLICEAAWRSAEPGLHFLERSNKRSNTYYFERLVATNPSLRAGTKVLTKEGIFPIEALEGKKFLVKNLDGKWSPAECFLSGRNKQLYAITLGNGSKIYATPEHKWPVQLVGGGFGKVTTDKLSPGNILPFPKAQDIDFKVKNSLTENEGFMVGWLYGDGWITQRGGSSIKRNIPHLQAGSISYAEPIRFRNLLSIKEMKSAFKPGEAEREMAFGFLFSEEDKALASKVLNETNKLKNTKSSLKKQRDNTYTIQSTSKIFARNLSEKFKIDKKEKGLPPTVWNSGGDYIKGLIDGLISSDGFVSKTSNRIVYTTKHLRLAEDVSTLLSIYGIKSRVRRQEATKVKFPNGKDYVKIYERYDLTIDGYHARNFGRIFKLSHPRKQKLLQKIIKEYKSSRALPDNELIRIKSVEKTTIKEDVWDISVYDDTHTFYINHCVTGNCGEQPLGPWAVCNLGAMNLSAYVTDLGEFDYDKFGEDVKVAIRFLDNVIDETFYFFKENEKIAKDIRRTGLGIMGLGDALIKMKLRYGAEDSLPTIEKIFKTLRDNAYEASSDIAREKGAFPMYDKDKYQEGYHIKNLPRKLREKIAEQGIRNAVLLTVAPTGTTSLVAGVTSGIEPVYEFEFLRRWRGGEEIVYHPLFEEWKTKNPDVEKRPDYFVSANDLTPEDHVHVQAIAQKYIDSSISKTVNAPKTHTVEDVQKLYMMAYDEGLKGITYMRDGSRQGVLERIEDKKEEEPKKDLKPIVKRPDIVYGFTRKIMTPLGDTFITVNSDMDGNPFEIFINAGKSGSDVMAMAEALGRMMSMVMRLHGAVDPQEKINMIANQLAGIGGSRSVGFGPNKVKSLPDAVARVLIEQFSAKAANGAYTNGHATNGNGTANRAISIPVDTPKEEIINSQSHVMVAQAPAQKASFDMCPECGSASLVHEEGCKKCYSCGYSEC